jgi:hypothetical protein
MAQLVPQANSRRIAGQKSTMRDGGTVPLFIKSVLHSVVSFCRGAESQMYRTITRSTHSSLLNRLLIFIMSANPKPEQPVFYFHCQGTVFQSNSHRPEAAHSLEG